MKMRTWLRPMVQRPSWSNPKMTLIRLLNMFSLLCLLNSRTPYGYWLYLNLFCVGPKVSVLVFSSCNSWWSQRIVRLGCPPAPPLYRSFLPTFNDSNAEIIRYTHQLYFDTSSLYRIYRIVNKSADLGNPDTSFSIDCSLWFLNCELNQSKIL